MNAESKEKQISLSKEIDAYSAMLLDCIEHENSAVTRKIAITAIKLLHLQEGKESLDEFLASIAKL
jgi:hypothetical protein